MQRSKKTIAEAINDKAHELKGRLKERSRLKNRQTFSERIEHHRSGNRHK